MSVSQESGGLAPVWFFSPEGFTPVALNEDPALRAMRFADFINALYPHVSPEEKLRLVAGTEIVLHDLVAQGAIYLASFMYSLDDEAFCSGMVTAFMMESRLSGRSDFVGAVVKEATGRFPREQVDTGVVTLPAGRAALITRDVLGPSPAALLSPGDPGEPEVQRQLEAYLPFPDRSAYLKIVIGTSDRGSWSDLLPIFGGFLAGISFSPHALTTSASRRSTAATDGWARREFG